MLHNSEHAAARFGLTDAGNIYGRLTNSTQDVLETLGNPNSDIPDIDAIAAIAHKHGLPLVIDNTFDIPYR